LERLGSWPLSQAATARREILSIRARESRVKPLWWASFRTVSTEI
jgi:hypothetical protein